MNQKLYELAEGQTPFEIQELNGHKVEVYLMDDFEGVKEEYVVKGGKFAVWTSVDGVNYRLFLENGYYDELKELYAPEVNQIWMDFWDKADSISKKFTKTFVYPMMAIAVILCIVSIFLGEKMGNAGTWVILGALILMFICMIFVNTKTKKMIVNENAKSRDLVVNLLGSEKFDALLDKQKTYMDSFFENLYPEDNEDEGNNEALADANKEEANLDNEESQSEATTKESSDVEAIDAEVVEAEVVEPEAVEAEAAEAEVVEAEESDVEQEATKEVKEEK